MTKTYTFLFIALCISLTQGQDFVAEIFRHGTRAPQPRIDTFWATDVGYSELTPIGIRQLHVLGAALKSQYSSLLLPYSMTNVHVFSTSDNRTIVSALAQLYGIYNGEGPNIANGLAPGLTLPPYNGVDLAAIDTAIGSVDAPAAPNKFAPIPIRTIEKNVDYLLESYLNCQNANAWFQSRNNDATVTSTYELMATSVQALRDAGVTVNSYNDFNDLGDVVLANRANGRPLPGGISDTSQVYKDLVFFTQWYSIYASLTETRQRQLFSGPFLYNFLNYVHIMQAGRSTPKFTFYAARESMLGTLLAAFGIMTPQCLKENWEADRAGQALPHPLCKAPIFGSSIIFEFYKTPSPKVKVKYNGDFLALCGGNTECTLTEFETLVAQVTDNTDLGAFHTKCGNFPTTTTPTPAATPTATPAAAATVLVADNELRAVDWVLIGLCIAFFVVAVGFAVGLFILKSRLKAAVTNGKKVKYGEVETEAKEPTKAKHETGIGSKESA